MIDIETWGTTPGSIILTIGAIKFNRDEIIPELSKMNSFYKRIDIKSCEDKGMTSDLDTQKWWAKQDKDIKYEVLEHPERENIEDVLNEFTKWFDNSVYIWSHGDDFDCVLLADAYRKCNKFPPWKYWNTRDTRTLYDIGNIRIIDLPQDMKHHPTYDCYRQIIGVKKALKNLKLINN